ncbi:hypothetical protein LI328DRAFT_80963 [Trichoderma asperelloides]|nr:hypothetical protein LI328DRAFT_80963 [Trichoderma asperelloides]
MKDDDADDDGVTCSGVVGSLQTGASCLRIQSFGYVTVQTGSCLFLIRRDIGRKRELEEPMTALRSILTSKRCRMVVWREREWAVQRSMHAG